MDKKLLYATTHPCYFRAVHRCQKACSFSRIQINHPSIVILVARGIFGDKDGVGTILLS